MGAGRLRNRDYPFRSRAQSTRQMDISPISTNFPRKPSTAPQIKRRKMMPRGPKGEKRPADVIGGAGIMVGRDHFPLRLHPFEPAIDF